jgi:Abnormal spindle-like microcephaly-assoc'd, ASPM-SPD-2-Hydin
MKNSARNQKQELQLHALGARFRVSNGCKPLALIAFLAVIVAIGGLSGCVGNGYLGTKTGTGKAGVLSGSVATVAFGNVGVNKTATQSVTITNTGTATVNLGQSSVTGTGFTIASGSLAGSVGVGQSVTVQIQFAPLTAAAASGSFTMVSDASNSPFSVALSGTGTQPGLASSPAAVSFGNVGVKSSGSATVTLSNTGSANVTIAQASVSGTGFTIGGLTAGQVIQPGQSMNFTAQFSPTSAGNASGSISVSSNAPNSPMTIAVTGTGAQPGLGSSPATISFGNVPVGTNGTASVSLSNTGTANVTISQARATGTGFSITGLAAGLTIQPGQNASFTAQFSPTSTGNASGSISVSSNAPNSPMTISVTGTGTQPGLGSSPSAVNFGGIVVGNNGSATVNLSNTGTASVTISQASVTGTGFTISGLAAGLTIQPGQNAKFTAQFSPASSGNASGSISVSSNAPNSPMTIALTGKGTQAQIGAVPSSAPFGNVSVGNSNSQTITLTNSGTANLVISQGSASGSGFTITGLNTPLTIPPGTNATFNAVFTPSAAGKVTGSVSLASDAPNSPLLIPLSGTGIASSLLLTFNVPSLSFGSVNVGSNSDLPATLTNTGNSNVTISGSNTAGAGFTVSGVSSGETLTPNQSIQVTVQFAPTTAGSVNGKLNVLSNATDSPTQVSLSGTGAQQVPETVGLAWTASTSTVIGYNVYRGTVTGGPYTSKLTSSPVASTQFTDTGVQSGQTYYYVVTSVDSSNVESVYSGQASAVVH